MSALMKKTLIVLAILAVLAALCFLVFKNRQGADGHYGEYAISRDAMADIGKTEAALNSLEAAQAGEVDKDIAAMDGKKAAAAKIDTQKAVDRERNAKKLTGQGVTPGSVSEFNPR